MNVILKNRLKILWYLNFKTIVFNFKYLNFFDAIQFPFFISSNTYLKSLKGNIKISGNKPQPGMIRIGYGDVGIFDKKRSRTIWEVNGNVTFGGTANIGHGSKIVVGHSGNLFLGNNFSISAESSIICFYDIEFGNDCLVSWDVLIMDTDFHKIYSSLTSTQLNYEKKILIKDKCWIGCRSLILKGVIIPKNTIVAANTILGALQENQIVENSIIGGMPIRILKANVYWER